MHPELFEIPFIHATVKSYGLAIVIGILAAIYIIRRLSDRIGTGPINKDYITNGALYALIAGVVGSRVFYVFHHYNEFRGRWVEVFSIWEGGLELLGGVLLSIVVIFAYLLVLKLPVRRFLDILAIGIVLVLGFGRLGCLMNGCCFGQPSDAPWAIRFPYASIPYQSQVYPDMDRNRAQPHLDIPVEFYGVSIDGRWAAAEEGSKFYGDLKPFKMLSPQQKEQVTAGPYRCLPVHPTQIYDSLNGFMLFAVLFTYWRFIGYGADGKRPRMAVGKPGCTFALMFMIYGPMRFFIESLRDDNPFEIYSLTISQLIGAGLFVFGVALFIAMAKMPADDIMLGAAPVSKHRPRQDQPSPPKASRSAS